MKNHLNLKLWTWKTKILILEKVFIFKIKNSNKIK